MLLTPLFIYVAQTIEISFVRLELVPARPVREPPVHIREATAEAPQLQLIADRGKWPCQQAQYVGHARRSGLRSPEAMLSQTLSNGLHVSVKVSPPGGGSGAGVMRAHS